MVKEKEWGKKARNFPPHVSKVSKVSKVGRGKEKKIQPDDLTSSLLLQSFQLPLYSSQCHAANM